MVDASAVPPGPVQLSVNVDVESIAAVVVLPLVACGPLHAPDAVQVAALVDDHVRVAASPLETTPGLEVIDTVGAEEGAVLDTVVDC